jgi:histidine triad (HIT) family protein
MAADPNCVFCKIVAGRIPCHRLLEDRATLAFLDINPANPGHALVIPKAHAPNLTASKDADLAAVMKSVRRVARAIEVELTPDGINLLQANGPGAAQSVFHFHVHVLPRRRDDGLAMNWIPTLGDKAELAAMAERLRRAIEAAAPKRRAAKSARRPGRRRRR